MDRHRSAILGPVRLTEAELRSISHLIPGPEPMLYPAQICGGEARILPVCETRLDGNERRYLLECLESNWISSQGGFVRRFEQQFATAAAGCAYGIACSSGTAALHLALAALGVGPGDEVILPAFTMIATANAVTYTGAVPILVDAERITLNIDPGLIEAKITRRTKAIIVVHTYGHPAQMEDILAIAQRHGLYVVEDAAEAHGAQYRNRAVGSLGDVATFSFYANKILTTGEGGMVTTNNDVLATTVTKLRDHAFSGERHFWHEYVGFNYRMTNLQAAVGLAQLDRFGELVEIRRQQRNWYDQHLQNVRGLTLPTELPGSKSVFWMYGVQVEDAYGCTRDELRIRLAKRGVETRTFFVPMHLQPVYYARYAGQRFPVAEDLCARGLYLPSGPNLTEPEIAWVCQQIALGEP